ncbi:MAG: DUF255 domain-containing protein [Planctomycetota bacterium]|nr:MAG: DUF255 domain-containing protein [Planctomycetota bacterium]REJ97238.1 MAG: DUF255 domain-containing protein [Planctomycetota bacterium]REK30312.1 MAG: DUF255 domain-containing protein [Planctomycetota bacterium]REK31537.1 MAG: DUF255 domain-containing protein [Planctomycetota bacterium]
MRHSSLFTVRALTALAIIAGSANAADQRSGWYTSFETAQAEAKRLNRPMLLHFYADWCGPCRQMEQKVLHRETVLAELRTSVIAVKINVDRAPALAARYNVDSLPMDVYIEPDGRSLMVATGYRDSGEYISGVRRAATRYSDLVAERSPPKASDAKPEIPETMLVGDEQSPMMRGYCPVTLWKNRKWEKGSSQFSYEYRGQTFMMASAEALEAFEENPGRYAPQYLGCDPVVVYQSDRAVLGSTKFGAFYDDQLYLFVTDDNRQSFKSDPDRYIRTRVVLNLDEVERVVR